VSGFVKKQLPMLLVSHMGGDGSVHGSSSVQEALRESFLEVDTNLAASSIDCEFSGCTCAVAHLQVGESVIFLLPGEGGGSPAGWPHTAQVPAAGGTRESLTSETRLTHLSQMWLLGCPVACCC
jgi:hypothetical protein